MRGFDDAAVAQIRQALIDFEPAAQRIVDAMAAAFIEASNKLAAMPEFKRFAELMERHGDTP